MGGRRSRERKKKKKGKKTSLDLEKKNTHTDLLFLKSQNKLVVHVTSKH